MKMVNKLHKKEKKHIPPIMQRGDFRRELRGMAKRCIKELEWNPEEDIAIIIARYNLDVEKIKKNVKEALTL